MEFATYSEPATNNDYTTLIAAKVSSPVSFMYNNDGTKLYILDSSGTLHQYSCSTAYGPPTTDDNNSLDMTGTDSAPVAVVWRSGSTNTFYMLGATGGAYFAFNGTPGANISTYSYASVSVSIPSISGTLEDFYTLDGENWLFNSTTRSYHHTSGTWESALTMQSESTVADFASFDSTGLNFYRKGGAQYRTETAYSMTGLYQVSSGGELSGGFPGGLGALTTNPTFKYISDTKIASVGAYTVGGSYYASWTLVDGQAVSDGNFRGAEVMAGEPYICLGGSVLKFDSSGKFSAIQGTLNNGPSGTADIVTDTDGSNIVFVTELNRYRYSAANGWETITDDTITNAVSTAYLDSTFYYIVGDRIYASDLLDPTNIESLNFITAESFTDAIKRNLTLNQLHYSLGAETTEIHFTSGVGNTRLSRQAVLEHGIIGKFAIDTLDDRIYFVDAERRLSVIAGFDYQPITINGLGKEWQSYTTVEDCIVNAYTFEQENFVDITFPTQNVTWTVHERSGETVKREDTNGFRARSARYLNVFGKTFSVDHSNGKVYQFSDTVYQDDGNPMTRTTYSAPITSEVFGFSTREFTLDALYIDYEVSGSTDFTVSVSFDSGQTFEQASTVTVTGRGTERLPGFGMASEVIVQISTSSNTEANLLGLAAEAEALDD